MSSEICRRTQCQAAYCRGSGSLFFYMGQPWRGMHWMRFYSVNGERRFHSEQTAIDDACRAIYQGRMPKSMKDRKVRWQVEQDEKEAIEARKTQVDNAIPDAMRALKGHRNKRGMGKHFRPSVVVDKKVV